MLLIPHLTSLSILFTLLLLLPFWLFITTVHSFNLSLPFQHPHPDAVVFHFHTRLNHSLHRRHMAATTAAQRPPSSSSSCLTGNPIDDCWRCDNNWASNRQRLADCGIGFGRYAMGGKGGELYLVTDSSDDNPVNPKPGTLRHAVIQTQPLWIVFSSSMVIHLKVELIFNSFKTVDGRGSEVHIVGGGCITLQAITNIIIHGIHVHHCYPTGNTDVRDSPTHYGRRGVSDGDGISISAARGVWIDHCDLSRCKDGLVDAVLGSTAITISNSRFSHHNEVMLLGHRDDYRADSGMQVTIAFNVFGEGLVQRMPRCRRGYIHVVNNDFTGWEMYAIGGSGGPTINSQGNRYAAPVDASAKEVTKRVETEEGEWAGWNWRSEGDLLLNGAFFVPSGTGVDSQYDKASSLDALPNSFVPRLTLTAGVLAGASTGATTTTPATTARGGGGGGGALSPPALRGDGNNGGGDGFYGMVFRGTAAPVRRLYGKEATGLVLVLVWQLFIGWIL